MVTKKLYNFTYVVILKRQKLLFHTRIRTQLPIFPYSLLTCLKKYIWLRIRGEHKGRTHPKALGSLLLAWPQASRRTHWKSITLIKGKIFFEHDVGPIFSTPRFFWQVSGRPHKWGWWLQVQTEPRGSPKRQQDGPHLQKLGIPPSPALTPAPAGRTAAGASLSAPCLPPLPPPIAQNQLYLWHPWGPGHPSSAWLPALGLPLFPYISWQNLKRTELFWLSLWSLISVWAKLAWLGTHGLNGHIRNSCSRCTKHRIFWLV